MTKSEEIKGTESIVVGVDGSTTSREALEWAAREAQLRASPLLVVTTWEYPTSFGMMPGWPEDLDFGADARRVLDEMVAALSKEVGANELRTEVIQGGPSLVLEDLSKGAALVVVGSRGHGGFAGLLLGSVSAHLAAHAHCPVVIVHHSRDASDSSQHAEGGRA